MKKLFLNTTINTLILDHIKKNHRNSGEIIEAYYTRYIYFLHRIYVSQTMNKNNIDCLVNCKKLSEILSLKTQDFNKIKQFFISNGIIEKTSGYIKGVKSESYKIKDIYMNNWTKDNFDNKVIKKIIAEEQKDNKMANTEFFQTYEKYLKEIRIDVPVKILLDEPELLMSDYFYFYQPYADNRIYHNISNMDRSLRKYLKWDNKKLYQIDITGSQMFLIAMMFKSHFKIAILPEDVERYIQHCKNGEIYEILAIESGFELTTENRSDFKKKVMSNFLFSKPNQMNNKLSNSFKKLFPNLYNFVFDYKQLVGASEFALKLQSIEWLIIQDIMIECYKQNIKCINLHDCIIINDRKQKDSVMNIFETEFIKKYNVMPAIKFSKF